MKPKIHTFTALDFETACGYRHSICQTGIAIVADGAIVDAKSWLCRPPDNYYWRQFTGIHGISPRDTKNSPSFDQVWPEIEPYITGRHVVAHNGFAFDFQCLARTLEYYGKAVPEYTGHCTYRLIGRNLKSLCDDYKIELDHHNAVSDARACAELFLIHQNKVI